MPAVPRIMALVPKIAGRKDLRLDVNNRANKKIFVPTRGQNTNSNKLHDNPRKIAKANMGNWVLKSQQNMKMSDCKQQNDYTMSDTRLQLNILVSVALGAMMLMSLWIARDRVVVKSEI